MYQFLAQLNQAPAARFQLELAIHSSPSDPEPYVILGNIALQERRVFEATQDFDKAKQLLEKYTNERKKAMEQQVMSGIAQVAEANEDWKVAQSRLEELLRLAPEDLNAHQRLAHSLFWQGKAKEAYEILKAAKKIDRENAETKKTKEVFLTPEAIMAQYYDQFEDKKSENPKKWFDAALRIAPKDLATRQVVALWAMDKGNLPFAKEQADAAVKIEESDSPKYSGSNVGHMLRGLVALWEKRWADAERDFETVILQVPNDFGAKDKLALALVEQKDDTAKQRRALDYARSNYSANDKNPDALATLGWVYFRLGDFNSAKLALEQGIRAAGGLNNLDTATYWAYILHHADRDWDAKEILKNLLDSERPFYMRREAQELYDKVKDAKKPAEASTPAPAVTPKTP
jgi:tetratricopeptide (TPR) repeat protein